MLRSALLLAICLGSSAALADKIVSPDGDSFFEINSAPPLSVLGVLNPINSAEAQSAPSRSLARPAFAVPEMFAPNFGYDMAHEFDAHYVDQILRPDYTAESFK